MATQFNKDEWTAIRNLLTKEPDKFGFPKRVYGTVVIGSFNIRKLGKASNRNGLTWDFLADVCRHFDLLAVQEVMDDLSGLRKLMEVLGPRFGVVVSDKTGVFPGESGNGERLAFIFNWSIVKRTEVASDITYDRTKVITTIAKNNDAVHAALADYGTKLNDFHAKMEAFEADNSLPKPKKPKFKVKIDDTGGGHVAVTVREGALQSQRFRGEAAPGEKEVQPFARPRYESQRMAIGR